MGLDQYVYKTKQQFSSDVDFNDEINHDEIEEIVHWHKHPYLQGFMTKLYYLKDGQELPYNLAPLVLTIEDLSELKELVINKSLPVSSGMCWGDDSSEHYYKKDLQFIETAIQLINEGYTVYYDCWW